ncbi:hypothetical protein [Nocardia sp. NPDC127526]|uniref:hypothetical protein n=1 Tax=Nocardia sp. NPDC127526 TaxID=3345393 RepID=UPI003628C143
MRKPRVYIDHKYKCITINGPYEYNVKLDRCRDYPSILGWAAHLSGKRWADADMVNAFIGAALKAHGLRHPGF